MPDSDVTRSITVGVLIGCPHDDLAPLKRTVVVRRINGSEASTKCCCRNGPT